MSYSFSSNINVKETRNYKGWVLYDNHHEKKCCEAIPTDLSPRLWEKLPQASDTWDSKQSRKWIFIVEEKDGAKSSK